MEIIITIVGLLSVSALAYTAYMAGYSKGVRDAYLFIKKSKKK